MHSQSNQIIKKWATYMIASFLLMQLNAQNTNSKNHYKLVYAFIDKDSSFTAAQLKLQVGFNDLSQAMVYVNRLPALLISKGFPIASIDQMNATDTAMYLNLYLGMQYDFINLNTSLIEPIALNASGIGFINFPNKPVDINQLQLLQRRLLEYYENEGYPFAAVLLDSIKIEEDKISANLKADKGVLYHIDSIRTFGKIKVSPTFLQRYLFISNGSIYSKKKLTDIDKRIQELSFVTAVQPSDLTMLGSGAVVNLYLQPKKSSQINFLVGFLPSSQNTGKLQLTGDVNLDLKNLLGGGERVLLKWQQLQPQSPRLTLGFNQPYIFKSSFGADFLFDLFKKDSNFLRLNAQVGLQYVLSMHQTGKLFLQWQNTLLLPGAVDTNLVKSSKKLPLNIDMTGLNIGLNYEWINTNYLLNPRMGSELNLISTVGVKQIKQNNDIVSLKDPSFNYASLYDSLNAKSYQLRVRVSAAHYFPIGKLSTIKTAINCGYYATRFTFRNELFQIGGNKLLRGFDEESIYANRFGMVTAEYRLLLSLNSYLSFFSDAALTKNKYQSVNINNSFIGIGMGVVYETKVGLLNVSYALGKRNDIKFNIKEASKIHFGYINYF